MLLLLGTPLLALLATVTASGSHSVEYSGKSGHDSSSDGSSAHASCSTTSTLQQKFLPPFLKSNPLPNDYPWGLTYGGSTVPPNTGVTRYYDFTIRRETIAPDGFSKPSILINGQFPGPLIEANWGDEIQGRLSELCHQKCSNIFCVVTVRNEIASPESGTTIHWHGLLQKGTPWMDGVPSVTQCPIAPGSTFTYKFVADSFGTSWYHSHYEAQLIDGVFGPMVIHGPLTAPYDFDLGPIIIQDYFHTPYEELTVDIMSNNATLRVQPTDNTLINGKMPYNCSLAASGADCTDDAQFSKFQVEAGKIYKLRLINAGAGSLLGFSIDDHELTIISNDFVPLEPYNVTFVQLGAGQRSDVLFTPKTNGAVWMRSQSLGLFCSRSFSAAARAVVLVGNTPEDTIPTTTAWPTPPDDGLCANDPLNETIPFFPQALPEPDITYNITINEVINATGHNLFLMNGQSFRGDFNDPVLLLANEKNFSYPLDWNVVNFGAHNNIRVNVWNNNTSPHPMHLHGHDMWVLNTGAGQWDGHTIVNPSNPQRRDVHNLSPFGFMVLQYTANNPGVWPFHCHIAFHLSQGLFMDFMEKPEEIGVGYKGAMKETCGTWDAFTKNNVVDQIDSGV